MLADTLSTGLLGQDLMLAAAQIENTVNECLALRTDGMCSDGEIRKLLEKNL